MVAAEKFWDKVATKKLLKEHAPELRPAETYSSGLPKSEVPRVLRDIFDERGIDRAVIKPHVGRNGRGIVLVERAGPLHWRFPWKTVVGDGGLSHQLGHDMFPDWPDRYLIEERFSCHPGLTEFTFYPGTSPLFRLLFDRHQLVVGALYTASREAHGFAQILVGGQCLWFDETGLIRPPEDMHPPFDNRKSKYTARTLETGEYNYLTIEGMARLVNYVESVLCPVIALHEKARWGLDVVIDADEQPRIVEVNHSPGCQMVGWKGWKPLTVEQARYASLRGGFLERDFT